MSRRMSLLLAVFSLACVSEAALSQSSVPLDRLSQVGRWFVDEDGRTVAIHGGNVSLPDFTGTSHNNGRPAVKWSNTTAQRMAEEGFNGVRLVIFFSQVVAGPGKIGQAHLDRVWG